MEETNNFLNVVYQITPDLEHSVNEEGLVVIAKPQNHWIQRFFRKIYIKIPEAVYMTLDDYGSFIMKQVDGKKTVGQIGEALAAEYEEASVHLYERLELYMTHLEVNEKWIQPIGRMK